ncbi:MAG: DUF1702 family protein [Sulfitobacter sp.]
MTEVFRHSVPQATERSTNFLNWIVARRVNAFRCDPAAGGLVKKIASTFVAGFRETLACGDTGASIRHVEKDNEEFFKPFFVEGAAMALATSNALPFLKATSRPSDLLDQLPGYKHVIYAGWGWWHALKLNPKRGIENSVNPTDLFSLIAIDGTAFARAFLFARPPYFNIKIPVVSYEKKRLWAQGYGRALWFLASSNDSIIELQRKRVGTKLSADLDSGLGLASGFAGMALVNSTSRIPTGANQPAYLQGYAFGLTARAMSTPATFSSWLASLEPSKKHKVKRLVARCLVEPRLSNDCPTIVYTKWQDELRAEFQRTEVSG